MIMVNGIPLVSDRYTGEERNLAIGAWGSFATAAGLLAPTLGGVLIDAFGWRAVFAINLPLGAAAWALAARVLPPASPAPSPTGRPDWPGSLLLMLGLGTATLLVLRPGDTPWAGQDTVALLTACLALAAFLVLQFRVPMPTLDLRMFTRPAFSGAMLAVLLSRVLAIGGSAYLVLYLSDGLGLNRPRGDC
ncbi:MULTISPECIES: MFS transporter [Streptomyces]|uniref:MFS transporter n=1 Tax=Streptomyces TaxID=1883 RepID=UPI0035715158